MSNPSIGVLAGTRCDMAERTFVMLFNLKGAIEILKDGISVLPKTMKA
jgi:hypothetical protein